MSQGKKISMRLTIFLGVLAALAPLSTDMYLPALPVMNESFPVETSMIQMTLTMTMIGMAVGQVFAGPISDMLGRKRPLEIGMTLFAISSAGCVFAEDIYIFLAFRLFQGLSGSIGIIVARSVARDVSDGPELTKIFSMLMLVNGLAPILAPVIGGQILNFTSWRGIFVLLSAIGVILILSSIGFTETLPKSRRMSGIVKSFESFPYLLRDKYFLGHCLMQCFTYSAFFAYIAGSSFLFQDIYGISPQAYSLIFGGLGIVIMIFGTFPIRFAGKIPDVVMLGAGLAQAVIGAILLLLCILNKVEIYFAIAALVVLVPPISVIGATSFSLALRGHGNRAGAASALVGFFQTILGAVITPLVGIAGAMDARPMGFIILTGECLAFITFLALIYARHKKGQSIIDAQK